MKAGIFLHSTVQLDSDFFAKASIFIAEHNEKGAMGFVINRPFPRKLNELAEFSGGVAFPLYDGGPVDREHLFFLHRRPDLVEGGTPVTGDIHLGGDFSQALVHLNNKTLAEKDIRLFIGYCGWDAGELETEIAEGSWTATANGNLF
ncbi:YqgE/AlgH family protein [Chitinophaga sp. GCM10012297]|uniref:YqgE/AlgH family protein n=1 Tax=Chitinophaga chungangae TaxID=2821488 RepID=A0ABS3YHS1_9BACT|nr:YqgE/AlgH family protein [Chitinophaga chungangae]MBO9153833.1 YqgE/AlgH family protein [Chitinophaga chungangae]